jgi:hypothetical protein
MASSFQHEVEQIEIRIRTLKGHLRDSAEESVSGSAAS